MTSIAINKDKLKENKEFLTQYLVQLNQLKSKMTFGNEEHSIKIEFQWNDTMKDSKWVSTNIAMEYYSCVFNLAVIYFNLGELVSKEGCSYVNPGKDVKGRDCEIVEKVDEAKLKESCKYYRHAAALFDLIKEELPQCMTIKDIPYDLQPSYMTFCSSLCTAFAQRDLISLAGLKKTGKDLFASLSFGVENLFKTCERNCMNLKKCDDNVKYYITHRRLYYCALKYSYMRDKYLQFFDESGKDYGKCVGYEEAIIQCLKEMENIKSKVGRLLPRGDRLTYNIQQQLYNEMYNDSIKIYHARPIDVNELEKPSEKIMANPQMPPDFNVDVTDNAELNNLTPREVDNMIAVYKEKINKVIAENITLYETELTIQDFLDQHKLPASLDSVTSVAGISDQLWAAINEVQTKGGASYLQNLVFQLDQKPKEIEMKISGALNLLQNESNDDNRLRSQYGNKWSRKASCELNGTYVNTLNNYGNKLCQARNCDAETKNEIQRNMQFYDLLGLSREKLNDKIPKKGNQNALASSPEAGALRQELTKIDALKEKCRNIVNSIYASVNDEKLTPLFLQVMQKKTTEIQIFNENKEKYLSMFDDLKKVTNEVKDVKSKIEAKNAVFQKLKSSQFNVNQDNEMFFFNLSSYCNLYNQSVMKLQQGLSFYKQFELKLNELNRNVTDFLMARDIDKNQLLQALNTGAQYQPRNQNINQGNEMGNNYWNIPQVQSKYFLIKYNLFNTYRFPWK